MTLRASASASACSGLRRAQRASSSVRIGRVTVGSRDRALVMRRAPGGAEWIVDDDDDDAPRTKAPKSGPEADAASETVDESPASWTDVIEIIGDERASLETERRQTVDDLRAAVQRGAQREVDTVARFARRIRSAVLRLLMPSE